MALLEQPGSTLLSLQELLVDDRYRQRVLQRVQDPFVRYFFVSEFGQYSERFRGEAIAPIQNKVGQFLLDPVLRHMVCQTRNKVSVTQLVSQGKFILARLPQAELGTTACRLLGIALMVRLLQAPLVRPLVLYVPELQVLAAPDLAHLLEQAGASPLQLVISTPSLFALDESLRRALLTHLRMMLAFRLGSDDARLLAAEFDPDFEYKDFRNLSPGQVIFKPLRRGLPVRPYLKGYVPTPFGNSKESQQDKIIRLSRERFAVPRGELEAKLARHLDHALQRFQAKG
jgi:hypothetical protein